MRFMSDQVENLQIENFKAFNSIKIEPKKLNIITGRNNTGKSSIIEAVDLVNNPSNIESFSSHGIRDLINLDAESSEITLNGEKTVKIRPPQSFEEINEAVGRKFVNEYQRINEKFDDDDETEEVSEEDISAIIAQSQDLSEKMTNKATVIEHEEEKNVFFDNVGTNTRRQVIASIIENLHPEQADEALDNIDRLVYPLPWNMGENNILDEYRLGGHHLEQDDTVVQEKIEKFVEEHELIENFSGFRDGEIVLEREDGELDSLPLAYMGDGFRAIIGLVRKIIVSDYNTVLVEEPENHLHPGYVSELVDFIVNQTKNSEIQFFITTHNADFIEEFYEERFKEDGELQEKFKLFRLQRRGFVESMDYEESRKELEDLKMDLRGNK
jgi:AAA15 family ATPase/GTPase